LDFRIRSYSGRNQVSKGSDRVFTGFGWFLRSGSGFFSRLFAVGLDFSKDKKKKKLTDIGFHLEILSDIGKKYFGRF
jgi:hypothetical protein